MNGLSIGSELLFIPLAIALWMVFSGDSIRRLIAVQLVTLIVSTQLVLLAIVFGTEQFADLGVTLALLGAGSTIGFAHFLERWL